jgi:hypothetical protein
LWKEVVVDTWTGMTASAVCDKFVEETLVLNVTDPWAIEWLRNNPQGKTWAENMGFEEPLYFVAERSCRADDPRPLLQITSPRDGKRCKPTLSRLLDRLEQPDILNITNWSMV